MEDHSHDQGDCNSIYLTNRPGKLRCGRPFFSLRFQRLSAPAFASDRTVAEWVLRMGGSVSVDGARTPIWQVRDLPDQDFKVTGVNLVPVLVDPPEFKRLAGLAHLKELYVSGRSWHSMPVRVSRDTLKVFGTLTSSRTLRSQPAGANRDPARR